MTQPEDSDALTEDGRAPVLGEDRAEAPPRVEDDGQAIDLPIEENDADAQPGA